jgi:hypothetical protein
MFAAMPLQAEIKLKDYEIMKDSNDFKIYINGVGRGYHLASANLEDRKQPALFCPPGTPDLDTLSYTDILAGEIQNNRNKYSSIETYVEIVLLRALENKFPCGKQLRVSIR